MRIIAGSLKGRQLHWPKTPLVRPMTDLVRESLFNLIGPVNGWVVLDAYAGSGSIGFEALSRGASRVEAIEILRPAHLSIRRNAELLGVGENYRLYPISIEQWLRHPSQTIFDLIVAGPPFASVDLNAINNLAHRLSPTGQMVVWHTSRIAPPELQSLKLVDSRKYGDSALSFYAQNQPL